MEIIINGKKLRAEKGQTILEVAENNGIDIPALCFHSDLCVKANCRICVVEIKGRKGLHAACSTKLEPSMEVITESPRIRKTRKINLELIFSQHEEECTDCIWQYNCELLDLAKKYNVKITRFKDRKTDYPVYQFGKALQFDSSKCIDCRNCVEMCQQQAVNFLEVKERGHLFKVLPTKDKKRDCIYCGQCLVHCPAGAFEGIGEFEDIEKPLQQKDKIVVFQFAPSLRVSIGELFNLPAGKIVTEKLAAGIKKLGADKVFDVSVGADFTTTEEAKELAERLKSGKNLPMFTSCCPSWVKFSEFYFPEFIHNLTTVRSPHIISGGLIKTYWAKQQKLNPEKIVVVSIMPCVSKKYEIERPELKIKGLKPVDYVLTTRELGFLFKRKKIDLAKVKPQKLDFALGIPTGAGVIYGASGGVMESALRTACAEISGKKLCPIDFKQARGLQGVKKARIRIGKKTLKIAVVNGTGNAKLILEELKKNPNAYDYVEVMACPGGCIGGGGQPVPTDSKIRESRARGLYQVDFKKQVRLAHQSPIVKKVYHDYLTDTGKIRSICHTTYKMKKREVDI